MSTNTLHRILRACMWASIASAVIYAFTGVGLWSQLPEEFGEGQLRGHLLVLLHIIGVLVGCASYLDGPMRD